jgi:hypothetical protein
VSLALVPARLGHALVLARQLRPEAVAHHATLKDTKRVLVALMGASRVAKAVIVDGRCIAIGGEIGAMLGPTGDVWAAVAPTAARHRFALVRLARHGVADLMAIREALHCQLLPGDAIAIKFARMLGFVVGSEVNGNGMLDGWLQAPAQADSHGDAA